MTLAASNATIKHKKWATFLLVLGVYVIFASIAIYPAFKFWNSYLIGRAPDAEQNAWNFWWIDRSFQQGYLLPYHSDLLYYPRGVSLAFHTLDLYNGYISLFLRHLFHINIPASYNTLAFLAFLVGALSAYFLVEYITGSAVAGFIAGIIYASSPFCVSRLHFGQLGLFTGMQYIPLALLFTLKGIQTSRWYYTMSAGIVIAIIGWQSMNMGAETFLFALLLLVLFGYKKLPKKILAGQLALLILVSGILMVPVTYPMARDYAEFKGQTNLAYSAAPNDLLNFILPDRSISTLWRNILGRVTDQPLTDYYQIHGQRTTFIGWGVILLAVISVIVISPKLTWRWWLVGGLSFILCIGPMVSFNGQAVIPNPFYALMSHIPIMGLAREPARWGVFLILALSIIIGYLCSKFVSQSHWYQGIFLLAGVLIYVEMVATPIVLNDRFLKIPPFYYKLAQIRTSGGIMEVPYDLVGAQGPAADYMVYQTLHGKPIASGYISRTPAKNANMFQRYPFINQLRARIYNDKEPVSFSDNLIARGLKELKTMNVEYVILHKSFIPAPIASVYQAILTQVITEPVYVDDQLVVWHIAK